MKPTYLIIHHSGGTDLNPRQDSSNYTVEQCNQDHKERFNFISSLGYYVGYQYVITKDGKVTQCRKDDEEGAHTIGHNKDSIGIMLCGNFDVTLPTEAQKTALQTLLKQKMAQYSIPASNIVPHRKFAIKTCYGSLLKESWARDLVTPPLQKVINKIINIFFMDIDEFNGKATHYEIVDKVTGEVIPVSHLGSADMNHDGFMDFVTHKENGEEVVFTFPGYENEKYTVRRIDDKLPPNA